MVTHQFEFGESPPCDLARKLIAEGTDPNDRLQMLRGGKPALTGGVGWFAKRAIRENAKEGPRYVKWRPFPEVRRRVQMGLSSPEVE